MNTDTHTAKLRERIAELEQELDDWRNAAKGAENPCPDEKHCTCVLLLHKILKDARAEIARLIDIEP
jgi:TATA-binding protein-associated factor Taf7